MLGINKIYEGGWLQVMNQIDNESIDLVATDAPYGINYKKWDKLLESNLVNELYRVLIHHGQVLIFAGWSNVSYVIECFNSHFILKNWIVWDRIKGRGAKTNLVSTREDILWFIKDEKNFTFNKVSSTILKKTKGMGQKNGNPYRALSNVWTDISPIVPWSKEKVDHPTQKPVKLMERIVNVWSNPDDTVLDCFIGSGTTAIACMNVGRNFIGIEKEEKYVKIARDRIKKNK